MPHFMVVLIPYINLFNRKLGNDQESIQLPNTFRSKTLKEKKDALKATAPQSKYYKQKAKRTVSFSKTFSWITNCLFLRNIEPFSSASH